MIVSDPQPPHNPFLATPLYNIYMKQELRDKLVQVIGGINPLVVKSGDVLFQFAQDHKEELSQTEIYSLSLMAAAINANAENRVSDQKRQTVVDQQTKILFRDDPDRG